LPLSGYAHGHGVNYSTRDHIIEPPAAFGDGVDQARATLELLRTGIASGFAVR
jgi:hypothetical protein